MKPSDEDSTNWIAFAALDADAETVSGRMNHVRSAFDMVLYEVSIE